MKPQLEKLLNQMRADSIPFAVLAPPVEGNHSDATRRFDESEQLDQANGIARRFDGYEAAIASFDLGAYGRFDAGESAFLARQLLFIQAKEVMQQYTALYATKFCPVDSSIPSGAEYFSTRISTVDGQVKVVVNYAKDFPRSEVSTTEELRYIRSLGNSYGYSIQDLRRSSMAGGVPLDQRRASTARMVQDRKIDTIACVGDSAHNLGGMAKATGVTVNTAGAGGYVGVWSSATAADILLTLHKFANAVVEGSDGVWVPDTMLFPIAEYNLIASKPWSTTGSPQTILATFLDTNPYIKNVAMWPQLNTAGASSVSRAICYKRSPEVLDLKIPQPFEQFAPQQANLDFTIPCHSRIGGVVVYYPAAMSYLDNLYT